MLIKQNPKMAKLTGAISKDIPKQYYTCDQCQGKHYYYGTAEPDDLSNCSICMNRHDWSATFTGTASCHHLVGKPKLSVKRNTPIPYRKK